MNHNTATTFNDPSLVVDDDSTFLFGGSFESDSSSSGSESLEEADPLEENRAAHNDDDDARKQQAAAAECLAGLNAVLIGPQQPEAPRRPSFQRLAPHYRTNSLPIKPALKKRHGNNHSPTTLRHNSVSFSQLQIREYDICLSDHPSCSYGPPIQLDWDYITQRVVDIEDYESQRLQQGRGDSPILSYNARQFLMLQKQYTPQELQEAVREVDRVKRQRLVTDLLWPVHPLDELWEDIVRHVRGLFRKPDEEESMLYTVTTV